MNKINKMQARKAYALGEKILLCPCKMRPEYFGVWVSNACGRSFDSLVYEFECHSCSDLTGYYTAYYTN